jgi:uncharacterized protein (TIGR03435 family)
MVCTMIGLRLHPMKFLGRPLLAAVFVIFAALAFCQTPAHTPLNTGPAHFTYDAVTIKPDDSGNMFWKNSPDGFSMGSTPAANLIRAAFWLLADDQIVGLPAWAKSEPLAIEAKMDADTAPALNKLPPMEHWKQTQLMMQALLVDRFALKFHRAARELPTYELAIAKGGSKMKKSTTDVGGSGSFSDGKFEVRRISMQNLAASLSRTVGRVVVDKTGLEGGYDFTLEFAPEGADASDTRPSIFTAVEEQLGLKLISSKGPVDVIVIDHIERPTAN